MGVQVPPRTLEGWETPASIGTSAITLIAEVLVHGGNMDSDDIAQELARAATLIKGLVGETVDTITINSLESGDAAFLGQIVSKLSPMIGNLLEARIIQAIDEEAAPRCHWKRQDPDFPDAGLFGPDWEPTGAGFEVKAWYALSTELTGRFRESQNLLAPRDVSVVVVAWMMSHVVYGTPQILDVLIVDASEVADSRDSHYHKPPDYLIVEPEDTTARTRNLQQTNVNGYKMQDTDEARRREARLLVREKGGGTGPPHSPVEQALARELMSRFQYRLDTNFAKIDRIDNRDIEALKSRVLAIQTRGRTMRQWAKLLRNLNSEDMTVARHAATVMQTVYDDL